MKEIFDRLGKSKDEFYQAKYDYYKKFNLLALTASCFAFMILIIVDWQISHSINIVLVIRRVLVLIPLGVVAFAYHKTNNYKIMSLLSFVMVHSIIWSNIWIISSLSAASYANDSFIFMGFLIMLVSFSAPSQYAFVAQWGLVGDVILSDRILHYSDFGIIISFNCQVVILLNLVNIIIAKLYYDQYKSSQKLELALLLDPLTQVYNRNILNNLMGENNDISSVGGSISVLIIDIDHFKGINDTYGHNEGDHILQFIAQCIRNGVRKQDIVIRWGGEEFVAILTDCRFESAVTTAERIREEIAAADNGICKATVSIGVAKYDGGGYLDAIKKADSALYQAKREGRNKVVCYEE